MSKKRSRRQEAMCKSKARRLSSARMASRYLARQLKADEHPSF